MFSEYCYYENYIVIALKSRLDFLAHSAYSDFCICQLPLRQSNKLLL